MSFSNTGLPHVGFTSDALGPILKKTLLNPALTLPLVLLARYTKKGSDLSILHEVAFGRVKLLLYLGLARMVNNYLSEGVLNNWEKDEYHWDKEVSSLFSSYFFDCGFGDAGFDKFRSRVHDVKMRIGSDSVLIWN